MKKILIISISVMLLCLYANAQPNVLWTQTFGTGQLDRGNCVQLTSDGGYIITGTYDYNFWSWDSYLYLLKIDDSGNADWQQFIGGDNTYEGFCVQQTSDGGFIIAGNTGYTYQFDVLLVKTDAYGNLMWTQIIGEDGFDTGYSVQQTSDGGYIVTGSTQYNTAGGNDVWLIKTDAYGIVEWSQTFGGSNTDMGESVQQTSDGGYIIAGHSASFGTGDSDAYIIKTDASGNEEWHQVYGGPTGDNGYDIQQTTDGGYIMAGMTAGYSDPNGDVYLIKMNASGTVEWIRHPGGDSADAGYSVQQTADGGYIVTGYTESYGAGMADLYLVKTDVDGNEEWQQTVGGGMYEEGYCVQQTSDDGYIVTGYTDSYGAGGMDIYVVRLDDGSTPPAVTVTLTPYNPPIQIPANGGSFDFNIAVENTATYPATFDIWTMVTLPNSNEYGPIINVQDFAAPGNWSADRDRYQFVPGNAPEGLYTYDAYIGEYPDNVWAEDHFDFEKLGVFEGAGFVNGWNCWGESFSLNSNNTPVEAPENYALFGAYPNPFNPETTISYQLSAPSFTTLNVFDVHGRLVAELVNGWRDAGLHEIAFDASDLVSGLYIYRLTAGDFSASGKMVLMK